MLLVVRPPPALLLFRLDNIRTNPKEKKNGEKIKLNPSPSNGCTLFGTLPFYHDQSSNSTQQQQQNTNIWKKNQKQCVWENLSTAWAEMKSHAKNSKKDLRKTGNGGIIIRSFCLRNNEKEKKKHEIRKRNRLSRGWGRENWSLRIPWVPGTPN